MIDFLQCDKNKRSKKKLELQYQTYASSQAAVPDQYNTLNSPVWQVLIYNCIMYIDYGCYPFPRGLLRPPKIMKPLAKYVLKGIDCALDLPVDYDAYSILINFIIINVRILDYLKK